MTGCVSLVCMFLFCACAQVPSSSVSGLDPDNFKAEKDGQETGLFILKNGQGMEVCVTNFGGRVVSVMVPDKADSLRDVVLGFDNVSDYMQIPSDFGASIGRFANRIAQGRFTLDGTVYELPKTISDTACTAVPTDGNTKYTKSKKLRTIPLPLCGIHRTETNPSRET